MLHSNILYDVKCNICNDIYYSKTICQFKVRVRQHLGITPLTMQRVKRPKESAIFDRILHSVNNPSFDDFETLAKDSDEFTLLLIESLLRSHL